MTRKERSGRRYVLRDLFIDRVDHVPAGKNQHADIVLFKGLTRREFLKMLRGSISAGSLPSSRPAERSAPASSRRRELREALDRHLRK